MRLLLDTHLLLWIAARADRVPAGARALILEEGADLAFSTASLWEIVIKTALGRDDFRVDAARLRQGLLAAGYAELPVAAAHVLAVAALPPLHGDPFDRLLLATAQAEGRVLLTADRAVAAYGSPARLVG